MGSPRLSAKLAAVAARGNGTLGVDDYMETALYDPEGGFYVRAADVGGARRAFATIPTLSPLLGRAILNWALALPGRDRGPVDLIEVGAGGGHLAAAILEATRWWTRRRLRYRIVEISPALREVQAARLARRRVTWHDSVADALGGARRPVVVSNELVDAFPCKLLKHDGRAWRELRLPWPPDGDPRLEPHAFDEDLAPFSACDPGAWPDGIPAGQIVEIRPAFRAWLAAWAEAAAGSKPEVLTIDYGDVMPALYRNRPGGTLRGYVAQQRLAGPALFRAPGAVDLTADVDFTDLQRWGRERGLRTVELTDQGAFLSRWLPAKDRARHGRDLARIADPGGAGGAFKVLWQSTDC